MIVRSIETVNLPDESYRGFWSQDFIIIPFVDGELRFTVDASVGNSIRGVCVEIMNGTAIFDGG